MAGSSLASRTMVCLALSPPVPCCLWKVMRAARLRPQEGGVIGPLSSVLCDSEVSGHLGFCFCHCSESSEGGLQVAQFTFPSPFSSHPLPLSLPLPHHEWVCRRHQCLEIKSLPLKLEVLGLIMALLLSAVWPWASDVTP